MASISAGACSKTRTSATSPTAPTPTCTYTLSSTSLSVAGTGGTASLTVNAGTGCAWTVSSNAVFVAITSATSQSGNGTINLTVSENTADTRKATKSRIGPWYVLQSRNPAAPGMTHDTLLGFVRKGRVKARSIVRGPTTHQLWRFACQVKGLSREFGVCYSCGGSIGRETTCARSATARRTRRLTRTFFSKGR